MLASGPNVVAVHPSLPVSSIKELVALAKQKPGELQYASAGVGSFQHLGGELFKLEAGVNMLHVPFKGGGPAMIDVIGGHTKLLFSSLVQTTPHIRSGKLKALGVGGSKRSPVLPDVPTVAEAGVPSYEAVNWWGLVAPAGTPAPIIERAAQGGAGGAELGRGAEAVRLRGRRDRAHEPGRIRRLHGEGNDQMGARREGGRHQSGVGRHCGFKRHRSSGSENLTRPEESCRARDAAAAWHR